MGVADAVVAELARRQHGVVSSTQLAAAGVSWDAIRHRLADGRLTRLHRGVYVAGPIATPRARLMAATLACGPAAALSHRAAAHLHGFAPACDGPIDVTVASGHSRSRPGLRVHRATLDPSEVTVVDGIRVTASARTIRDLAAEQETRELRRTVEEAQVQRRLDHRSLTDAVDRARGHRGARALRAAAATADPSITRSEAERRLNELIRAAGLPRPETNVRVGRHEVDVLWRRERLIVEVDGFAFHGSRQAFERDRRRDAELIAQGYRVIRVTWRQLTDEPERVVAQLAAALAR